jgi:hypothetical protein
MPRKALRLSLRAFIEYRESVREFDGKYELLGQARWMLDNFRFDDRTAEYEALPTLPNRGALWWKALRG